MGPITVKALADGNLGLVSGYLTKANSPLNLDIYIDTPLGHLAGLIQFEEQGQFFALEGAYVVFARYGDVLAELEVGGLTLPASGITQTGPDGRFLLPNMPAGFGQLLLISQQYGVKQAEISVVEGQVSTFDWLFQEDDELQFGGIARGRVTIDGIGVADAWVAAAGRSQQTDANGNFEITDLPLDLSFSLSVFLPGSTNPNARVDLFLTDANPLIDNLLFNFDPPVQLSGVLLDEFGAPMPFEPIFSPPYVGTPHPVAETDSDGFWQFTATKRGSTNLSAMVQPGIASLQIIVNNEDIPGLTIQQRPTSAMRVQVFDPQGSPILAKVRLKSLRPITDPDLYGMPEFALTHDLLTDATGVIEFNTLNSGDFEVWATNPLYGDTETVVGFLNPRDPGDPLVISLSFQEASLANLFGTVFDDQGLPAGERVHVQASFQATTVSLWTNPAGNYRYESLVNTNDPTRVKVVAYDPMSDRFDVATIDLRQSLNFRQDLFLKNRRNVVVRVEDHEGVPVEFAAIRIEFDNVFYTPPPDPTDPESVGDVDLRRISQIDQITAAQPEVTFAQVPIGPFTVQAASGNGLVALRSFVLPNESGDFEVVVRLEASSSISGTFLDHSEMPIGDAEVALKQGSRVLQQRLTSGDPGLEGRFEFTELPMRTYQLQGTDPASALIGRATVTTSAFSRMSMWI